MTFEEIEGTFEDAIQSGIVFFRVHYSTLTLDQISKLLIYFSELVPEDHQSWMIEQTAETVIWCSQLFLEKLNHQVELNQECFLSTMKALGKFGSPLRDYSIKSDPDQLLWKLCPLAMKLVPSLTVESLVDLVHSFGQLKVRNEEFLEEVNLYLEVHWNQFDAASLISIFAAFGRLNYDKTSRMVKRLTSVISENIDRLKPAELVLMISAITALRWRNAFNLWKILIDESHNRLLDFTEKELILILKDLYTSRNHPGDGFLKDLNDEVLHRVEKNPMKKLIVEGLMVLGQMGFHHNGILTHLKQHYEDYEFSVGDGIRIGWVLSLLNAFDELTVRWWVKMMESANLQNTTAASQRQFYQTLMHIYVLQSDFCSLLDVDTAFERKCMENWKRHIRQRSYTSRPLLQMFVILRDLGFVCHRSEYVLGWRLSISTFSHNKYSSRFCLMVLKGFDNAKRKLRGGQKWKLKILEHIGWSILLVYEDEWLALSSKELKREFLLQRLKSVIAKRMAIEKGASPNTQNTPF